MFIYSLKRFGQILLLLLGISFALYLLIGLMPGDPVDLMATGNPNATAEDIARLRAYYGLDTPLIERYWHWLKNALLGDFGYSRLYFQPVLDVVWPRLMNTLLLVGSSLVFAFILATAFAILAAINPYSKTDIAINIFCFAGISMPSFWLAILMIIVFSVELGWLPPGGSGDNGFSFQHFILPVLALSMASIGGYIRHIRAALLVTLQEDYIKTARAKGLSRAQVLIKHALPKAMLPVSTLLALDFGTLFSGAVITETIFNWQGMGRLIYDAVLGNDFNLALVCLLFVAFMILIGNYLVDILYTKLDPRVRLGNES